MNKNLLLILILVFFVTSCEDILSPDLENNRTFDDIYSDAYFAEGLLMNAYTRLPYNNIYYSDAATDNAVINDKFSSYRNMATGQWSAIYNPVSQWENAYTAINYLNLVLEHTDSVKWSRNDTLRLLFNARHKGEAYALRALFMFYLLQAHAGYVGSQLMGVPILTRFVDSKTFTKPSRATFEECINQVYNDLDQAEQYLPLDYRNLTDPNLIPSRYAFAGIEKYNTVFGDINRQRISGRIVKAFRAKTALLKASPAFEGTQSDWEKAANYSAQVIQLLGGLEKLDPKGYNFYKGSNVDAINLTIRKDQAEMLWRGSLYTSYDIELTNFPPTLYGNGRINPSQNLVDAFPAANGYPIDHPNSGYDPNNPYSNRDPRLLEYIVVNGSTLAGKQITTAANAVSDDAIDKIRTSTRTGYYLKKLLREDVNLDPTSRQGKLHFNPYIRYTEILLIYAEAANEAWGPDADGGYGFSARAVIGEIRKRAGIKQPDEYLASITSKEQMRELIRNERRIELCFEGHRFWDVRRWKENLTIPVKGVRIVNNNFNIETVENRMFQDYMYYGPIPYEEIIKNNLQQNNGW
ncbi:MAG: RagB/SusD family nutrient uptake outer membrane protein [Bacteroidales bacterium]|nr:RagB/SusD family nutrient uptake outer membrane protein [Bacteroidales bacterium]